MAEAHEVSQEIHLPEDWGPIVGIVVALVAAVKTLVSRLEQESLCQAQGRLHESDVAVSVSLVDWVLVAPEKQLLIREEGWVGCD
jgi:hypothetical protein